MTILKTHHFDSGTAGNQIAAATEGFDGGGAAGCAYAADGISGTCARTNANAELYDRTSLGAYRGFYLRLVTAPTADGSRLMATYTSASYTMCAYLSIGTASKLSIWSPWSAVDTAATALTTGTWYWVEWYVDLADSTQELRLYDSTGQTLIDTLTGACRPNGETTFSQLAVGEAPPAAGATGLVFDIDEYVIADDWPTITPPATGPRVRGVIVGGAEVGASIRGVISGGSEVAATVQSVTSTQADPNIITFSDFTGSETSGLDLTNTGNSLVGDGINQTTYEMVPNSSTKGSYVAGLTSGQTNQCRLIFVGNTTSSGAPTDLEVANFTLQGTDQGHIYNGLEVGYSTGANVHDLKILSIPGNDSAPPGETFSLSMWHANSSTVTNVTLDGEGIAASLLGLNSVDTITVSGCTFTGSGSAFTAACWQCQNVTFENCTFENSLRGLNIENPNGGYHKFINCTFTAPLYGGNESIADIGCGMWVAPNGSNASTVVTFQDPIVDSWPLKIRHFPVANYPNNIQKDSDIHLVIDGVDVTSDTTKFQFVTTA